MFSRPSNRSFIPFFFHTIVTLTGILMLTIKTNIMDALIDEILVLKPSSFLSKKWEDPTVPVTIKLYFFNWTNPQDFKNVSIKPKFVEMGPYIYNQKYKRVNVEYHENFTVSYRNNKTFHFDEVINERSEGDNVTSLNVVPLIAADQSKKWNFFLRKGLSIALNTVPHHITKTVKETTFSGYEHSLLNSAKYFSFVNTGPALDKFAWFYKRNGSADFEGNYNIGTGLGNTTVGTIYNWNFRSKGPYDGSCSNIRASGSEVFKQRIDKNKLEFFFADFCRIIQFDFNKTVIWNGIKAYKFVGDVSFLDNGAYDLDKKCFCERKCRKFGVVDYSPCKFGVPAYLSFPHFLKADPSYRNDVEGMNPDMEKHEMYMIINPRTGIVLEAYMGTQVNILVEANLDISMFRDVPEVMFPVFWFTVKTTITEDIIFDIKLMLHWIPMALNVISVVLIFLGFFSLIRTIHTQFVRKTNKVEKIKNFERHIMLEEELKPFDTKERK